MAWTLVQDVFQDFLMAATLPSTPTIGNVVVVGTFFRDTVGNVDPGTYTCIDGNSVVYDEPASSPSVKINRGSVMLFYHIVVGGESTYVETHCLNGDSGNVTSQYIAEFAPPGGATPSFDGSTQANGTAAASTFAISSGQATAGSMVVPCAGSDDLFVNIMVGNPATPGAVSPWVRNPADPGGENPGMAYALTGAGPKTISWTGTAQIDFSVVGVSFKTSGGSGTSVALSGVSSTGSRGTVGPAFSGLTALGRSATGSAGTDSGGITLPLVGRVGTSATGSIAPAATLALPSQSSMTGAKGLATPSGDVTLALVGSSASGSVGTEVAYKGTVIGFTRQGFVVAVNNAIFAALSGVGSTGAITTPADSGGDKTALLIGSGLGTSIGTVVAPVYLSSAGLLSSLASLAGVASQSVLTSNVGTLRGGTLVGHIGPGPLLIGVTADDPPVNKLVRFDWQADSTPGVTDYHIEVGSVSGLSDVGDYNVGSTATTFTITLANGLYFTRIRSYIGATPGAASAETIVVVSGRTGLVASALTKNLTGSQALGLVGPISAQNNVTVALGGIGRTAAIGSTTPTNVVDVTVGAIGQSLIVVQGVVTDIEAPPLVGSSLSTGTGFHGVMFDETLVSQPLVVASLGVLGASVSQFVTAPVSGVQSAVSTGTVGVVAPDRTAGLSGIAITASQATIAASISPDATAVLGSVIANIATGSLTVVAPDQTMALSGSALNGSLGSLGVTVSSVIAVALTGTAAGSAIHGPTMSQAAALAGQEIDILNQAIVGGLQLNTIPLHVLMGLIDTDLALGLGGLQAGTNTGIMDRTLPIAEEDWICIIDEDDWTVVIR